MEVVERAIISSYFVEVEGVINCRFLDSLPLRSCQDKNTGEMSERLKEHAWRACKV